MQARNRMRGEQSKALRLGDQAPPCGGQARCMQARNRMRGAYLKYARPLANPTTPRARGRTMS